MARHPPVGQGRLIIKDSWSHSDTPQSVGLLWTSDQTDGRVLYLTSLNAHKRQTYMTPAGFETAIPASERPQTSATGNRHEALLRNNSLNTDALYIKENAD